jgi:hypothetical protein
LLAVEQEFVDLLDELLAEHGGPEHFGDLEGEDGVLFPFVLALEGGVEEDGLDQVGQVLEQLDVERLLLLQLLTAEDVLNQLAQAFCGEGRGHFIQEESLELRDVG